jgi:hypothetical protein
MHNFTKCKKKKKCWDFCLLCFTHRGVNFMNIDLQIIKKKKKQQKKTCFLCFTDRGINFMNIDLQIIKKKSNNNNTCLFVVLYRQRHQLHERWPTNYKKKVIIIIHVCLLCFTDRGINFMNIDLTKSGDASSPHSGSSDSGSDTEDDQKPNISGDKINSQVDVRVTFRHYHCCERMLFVVNIACGFFFFLSITHMVTPDSRTNAVVRCRSSRLPCSFRATGDVDSRATFPYLF